MKSEKLIMGTDDTEMDRIFGRESRKRKIVEYSLQIRIKFFKLRLKVYSIALYLQIEE